MNKIECNVINTQWVVHKYFINVFFGLNVVSIFFFFLNIFFYLSSVNSVVHINLITTWNQK